MQRNAAALALVRKRGGMQSVAFVPRGGTRGATGESDEGIARCAGATLPPIQYISQTTCTSLFNPSALFLLFEYLLYIIVVA